MYTQKFLIREQSRDYKSDVLSVDAAHKFYTRAHAHKNVTRASNFYTKSSQ